MLGGISRSVPTGSAPVIGLLAAIFVCAIAFAVPPAPIDVPQVDAERGFLLGVSRFSDQFAEQLGRGGYTYIAIDLTNASLAKDTIWLTHFDRVSKRRFPVWGWVEVRSDADLEHAADVMRNLTLGKLFVYGPDAAASADAVRRKADLLPDDPRVIAVVRMKDTRPDGEHAVAMTLPEFQANANKVNLPILIADELGSAEIHAARAAVEGDYLIAVVAVLD